MKRLFLVLFLAALFTGCSTIHTCDIGGHHTVDIENSGWYLFRTWPIASGDPDTPNESGCCLFQDTVTLKSNMALLNGAVRRRGARGARNIVSRVTSENVFFILFSHKVYHTSAEFDFSAGGQQ